MSLRDGFLALVCTLGSSVGLFSGANAQCNLTGYLSYVQTLSPAVVIPDNNATGITTGPLSTANNATVFTDVIVGLKLDHTWVGDLVVRVSYDESCDGTPEATATLLCRPLSATCVGVGTTGCQSDIRCTEDYLFSDAGTLELGGIGACDIVNGFTPGGCYRPSILANQPLSAFDGLMSGGCFKLSVSDNAADDLGALCEWSVHTLNEPATASLDVTWGSLKAQYR